MTNKREVANSKSSRLVINKIRSFFALMANDECLAADKDTNETIALS